jgi:hypothetical protein
LNLLRIHEKTPWDFDRFHPAHTYNGVIIKIYCTSQKKKKNNKKKTWLTVTGLFNKGSLATEITPSISGRASGL